MHRPEGEKIQVIMHGLHIGRMRIAVGSRDPLEHDPGRGGDRCLAADRQLQDRIDVDRGLRSGVRDYQSVAPLFDLSGRIELRLGCQRDRPGLQDRSQRVVTGADVDGDVGIDVHRHLVVGVRNPKKTGHRLRHLRQQPPLGGGRDLEVATRWVCRIRSRLETRALRHFRRHRRIHRPIDVPEFKCGAHQLESPVAGLRAELGPGRLVPRVISPNVDIALERRQLQRVLLSSSENLGGNLTSECVVDDDRTNGHPDPKSELHLFDFLIECGR